MGISDYYFTEAQAPDFDDLLFLTVPQRASSPGGGYRLLGSLVERRASGPFRRYPVPELLAEPGGILDAVVSRREQLGLVGEELTPSKLLAGTSRSLTVQRRHLVDVGMDKLPMVPAELSLGVDYGRMKDMSLQFGEDTRLQYIPRGYLHRLFHALDGDDGVISPTGLLKKHFVVQAVLLARNFSLTFTSMADFDGAFRAAVSAKNASAPLSAGLDLKLQVSSDRDVTATVSSDEEFLVGIRAYRWRNFDLS